jgi:hypothetical protein
MSRLSQYREEDKTMLEHDDGIKQIMPFLSPFKPKKIVFADFDSLIFWTLYQKDEFGNVIELTEEHLEMLYGKLDELVMKIINKIENYIDIEALFMFIRGESNFRKELFPEYKSNRKQKSPLTDFLYKHMEIKWNAIKSQNCESEDMCYSGALKLNKDCVILYCDHDIEEIDTAWLYNYQRDKWSCLTEAEGRLNRVKKLILGESGDGVNLSKGLGKKHFESFYNENMTEEEIENQLLKSYTKVWKTEELAKEKLELAKKLLYLKNIN